MKKRVAVFASLLFLMPLWQSLSIGAGVTVTSAALILASPQKANADDENFYNNSGGRKIQSGDYSGAISDYTKAIRFNPKNSFYYFMRGSAHSLSKNHYLAISDFTKVIELNSGLIKEAYEARGISKSYIGDMNGHCSDVRKSFSLGNTSEAMKRAVRIQCQ